MTTKLYSTIVAVITGISCVPFVSCSESDEFGDGKYTVSKEPHKLGIKSSGSTYLKAQTDDDKNFIGYTFDCAEGTKSYTFNITAENTPWTITNVPSWISVSPRTGVSSENITMDVQANTPTETERTANITLKSTATDWEYTIPITITQAAASPRIYERNQFSNFGSEGETKQCELSSNFTPTVSYEGNDGNWMYATIERNGKTYYELPGYTLNVTVKPNSDLSSRTGYILLQYNGKTIGKVEVTQYAFYPSSSVSNSYLYISSDGETKVMTYTANFIPTVQYDEIKNWCDVSLDTNAKTITLNVKPNKEESTRSGYIYLMYKGKKMESVNVYQYAFSPRASFGSNNTYIDKNGGTLTLNYTANFIPTVKCNEEWCDVSINTSTKKVTMNVKPNTSSRPRNAYIYLLYKGEEKASLRLVQDI